ncbi:hypothetical protein U9M48_025531 [Paspalum notatum var. saurae]|uniref:Fatty acyl-CoA reductase n=1 Tax=Paspalum notatum var. saurae TaxID=547442 RepID=A0AAQ3WY12_PASNO
MKELGLKRSTKPHLIFSGCYQKAKYFGWPNVYALTKAMGEMLHGTMRGELPLVIVRPSIIISTFQDPFPGWIEGLRTIDVLIAATYEQKLPCFITGRIIDSIPGDMVVNATMVAMVTHYNDVGTQVVYHVTSALQNALPCNILDESTHAYCLVNPRGQFLFSKIKSLSGGHLKTYYGKQVLYLANYLLLCGRFTSYHNRLNRSLDYLMFVAKLYTPYVFFKGSFDDTNLRKLWGSMCAGRGDDGYIFNFDPSCINWRLYLFNTHIPAVLKVAAHMKKESGA